MASSKHTRWGVDVDGVVADWVGAYRQLARELHGVELPDSDSWHWMNDHLTPEQELRQRTYTRANPEWWLKLQPLADTQLALAVLNQAAVHRDIDLYFITHRPGKGLKAVTEKWLTWQGVTHPTVIVAERKGPVAAGLELDVFVDDKPENCLDVLTACPDALVSLITRPWNADFVETGAGTELLFAPSLHTVVKVVL